MAVNFSKANDAIQTNIKDNMSQLITASKLRETLQAIISDATTSIQTSESTQVPELEKKIQELQNSISSVDKKADDAKTQASQAATTANNATTTVSQLNTKVSDLQRSVDGAVSKNATQDNQIAALQKADKDLQDDILSYAADLQNNIEQVSQSVKKTESSITGVEQTAMAVQNNLDTLNKKLKTDTDGEKYFVPVVLTMNKVRMLDGKGYFEPDAEFKKIDPTQLAGGDYTTYKIKAIESNGKTTWYTPTWVSDDQIGLLGGERGPFIINEIEVNGAFSYTGLLH